MTILRKIINTITKPKARYEPLITVKIYRDNILHNLHQYQQHYKPLQFAPVLKSNAYGHGLVEVGKIVDKEDIPFIMVDSFYEALTLRQHGITKKILILGYNTAEQTLNNNLTNINIGIVSFDQLREFDKKISAPHKFHLKIDTGMHRQGILPEQVNEAVTVIKSNRNFILEGIATHFADSDNEDESFTNEQIKTWNSIVRIFRNQFPRLQYFHGAASAGSMHSKKIDANVCRLGISLYGIRASDRETLELKPALEMQTVISGINKVPAGSKVGYGITYTTSKPTVLGTIPVGYNEGLDRRLSNQGHVIVKGVPCPIVGRVSMNITTVNVTDVPDIQLNDEVIVISKNPKDLNSLENIAKLCNTAVHEPPVHIPPYLKRIII